MPMKLQLRTHTGHHHHHHHHDNTFLLSTDKKDAGVRITRIGLYVNLGMAIGKGFGGYVFHSQALVADAVHSLTDLVSDIMTLLTVSWSLKPPSAKFPSGYGKVESLGSLGVSGILLGGGVMMGWAALLAIGQQFFPEFMEVAESWGLLHGHGHSHHHHDMGPNINAAWLAGGSIIIKEWLYRATLKVAKERKSSVLASNAYHHRVDSLTALVALLMIGGSNIWSNASWLDPVGGLVISLMVIQAGWGNTKSALFELADVGVDEEMRNKVQRVASRALESYPVEVRQTQGIKSGQNYLMDLEVAVPANYSIEELQEVENHVRERLGATVRGVKKVKVRFISKDLSEADIMDEYISADVSPPASPVDDHHRVQSLDDILGGHSHDHDHSHDHSNGKISKRK